MSLAGAVSEGHIMLRSFNEINSYLIGEAGISSYRLSDLEVSH